jgi:peptide/nickel transport system substrate-binding protein
LKKLGTVVSLIGIVIASSLALAACGSSSSSSGGKEGGTLKGAYTSFPDYMDPQLSYTAEGWTTMYNTYIPLLTYAHASGEAGSQVVPGLAEALPKITNGGKTYKLTMRKGLKYSNGTPVKASDFQNAVERMYKVNSGGSFFYDDIVGATEFAKTKKGHITGIKTDDATGEITIDLVSPRGTFTNELALMFVAPVPPDTPDKDQSPNPPPATGPYEITQSDPGRSWTLERNPQWDKNNAKIMPDLPGGHIDKFDIQVIRNESSQVNDIEQGKLNWMFNPPPSDRYAQVKAQYDGTQFRVEPTISTYYFWMNTQKAPFDDPKVRQAVNYAVDPAALERIYAGQLAPTQQILPPGMPGYKKFELYPHDMNKAKQMFQQANPADKDITVWTDAESPNNDAGTYYQDILNKLGFNAQLKILNPDNYFTIIGNAKTPDLDTGWSDWFEDYPHPSDFFDPLLNGENIAPVNNNNFANMDDPELNAKINELAKQDLGSSQKSQYAALDKSYMEQAPWAPYGNRILSTFVSSDIDFDKIIWNPTFEDDFSSIQFK